MIVQPIEMTVRSAGKTAQRTIEVGSVSGARFSSRDLEATRRELDERAAQGLSVTKTNPSIFHIARYLLTQAPEFEVQGPLTGGEVEATAIRIGDEVLITVGSDHCDRELDPLFQDKPKQMCPHPIATTAWPYQEVRDHWDELRAISKVVVGPHTITVQDSYLSALVDMDFLLAMDDVKSLADPAIIYGGTTGALPEAEQRVRELGLPPETVHGVGDEFILRLHDPVLDRTIEHRYRAVPVGDDLAERRDA